MSNLGFDVMIVMWTSLFNGNDVEIRRQLTGKSKNKETYNVNNVLFTIKCVPLHSFLEKSKYHHTIYICILSC